MKVQRIVRKDDESVVVHLDNGEVLFLTLEVLLKHGIRPNTEIDEEKHALLIAENRKYYVKKSALGYIARRQHSSFELLQKLRKKGYENEFIEEVLDSLLQNKLLDDEGFAYRFAEENLNRKKWGKKKMEAALMQRGIKKNTITEVLNNLYGFEEELENAKILAVKKVKSLQKRVEDSQKLKQKVYMFLISRGFSYDIASEAVKYAVKECIF